MPDHARTAIPAFVGYTQTAATIDGKPVSFTPVPLASLADYRAIFGGASSPNAAFTLYDCVKLFYANGGGPCYVCSAGRDADGAGGIDTKALLQGLAAVGAQPGPTLLAIPEAVLLPTVADFAEIARQMLAQCATRQDRIAILDVYGADSLDPARPTHPADLEAVIARFHDCVGDTSLNYGAAYFPFLVTSEDNPRPARLNVLPPSAAMAGVYSAVDSASGVWHAPANIALSSVVRTSLQIDADQQQSIGMPLDGKSINVIRDFADRGAVVWGARTLDANSLDWRYVHVRRAAIYIETSIKARLRDFASAANNETTWMAVIECVSSFLQDLWSRGGLAGAEASEAFAVECGAGSTMTAADIAEGSLNVIVRVSLIQSATFIELAFTQQMQVQAQ
jgi:phage tail sheath protein FI